MSEFRRFYLTPEAARIAILRGFLAPQDPDDDQTYEVENGAVIEVSIADIEHFKRLIQEIGLVIQKPKNN